MNINHNLSNVLNTVKKSNDIKLTFYYLVTTGASLTYRILRFLNY